MVGARGIIWGQLSARLPRDAEPVRRGTAASHFVARHKDPLMALAFHHLCPVIFEPEAPLEWTSFQGQSFPVTLSSASLYFCICCSSLLPHSVSPPSPIFCTHLSSISFALGQSVIYLHSPNLLPSLLFELCSVLDMYTPVTLRVSP